MSISANPRAFTPLAVPFTNLASAHANLEAEIAAAVQRILRRGWFVLGPEVEGFEAEFARANGVAHAVGVANGTDALELALRAIDVGPGDEVITVSHTAVPTVCAIERAGAVPILVDIHPDSCTIDPAAINAAVTPRTRAIVPVHLYGQPADMPAILAIAQRHGLAVIEDCAQAHGATIDGQPVGTIGTLGAFSFYPTKNLAACGDAGAIITRDAALAVRLRQLRQYGQTSRYVHARRGINSRLDEIQAAILRLKLPRLASYIVERREFASVYDDLLPGALRPGARINDPQLRHAFHLYVIRHRERERLRADLHRRGIETLVHYPTPVHRQPAYADLGYGPGSLPETERAAEEVVSLPLFNGMSRDQHRRVVDAVGDSIRGMGT